jgi:DNA-binding protein HU-beta
MKNLNKAELIALISTINKCSKKEAEDAIEMFVSGIKKGLAKADKVTLVGFGTFYKQNRKAGKGRNPRTGAEIKIPASVLPKFKAGQGLKDACK